MADDPGELTAKLFAMFKVVIEDERRARSMYREVMRGCSDEVMQAVLGDLFADEVRHEQRLLAEYRRLRGTLGDLGESDCAPPAPG